MSTRITSIRSIGKRSFHSGSSVIRKDSDLPSLKTPPKPQDAISLGFSASNAGRERKFQDTQLPTSGPSLSKGISFNIQPKRTHTPKPLNLSQAKRTSGQSQSDLGKSKGEVLSRPRPPPSVARQFESASSRYESNDPREVDSSKQTGSGEISTAQASSDSSRRSTLSAISDDIAGSASSDEKQTDLPAILKGPPTRGSRIAPGDPDRKPRGGGFNFPARPGAAAGGVFSNAPRGGGFNSPARSAAGGGMRRRLGPGGPSRTGGSGGAGGKSIRPRRVGARGTSFSQNDAQITGIRETWENAPLPVPAKADVSAKALFGPVVGHGGYSPIKAEEMQPSWAVGLSSQDYAKKLQDRMRGNYETQLPDVPHPSKLSSNASAKEITHAQFVWQMSLNEGVNIDANALKIKEAGEVIKRLTA